MVWIESKTTAGSSGCFFLSVQLSVGHFLEVAECVRRQSGSDGSNERLALVKKIILTPIKGLSMEENLRLNNHSVKGKVIKICLIEDDKLDEIQVTRAFRQKGILFNLDVYQDGESAFKALQNEEPANMPDIVLLDLSMPKMNGIEFLTEIRRHDRFNTLKIFVLSNSDQERAKCEKLGVSGYILKPLKLNSPSMDTISLLIDVLNI